ncbi:alpha/beta hydrolase [Rhodococcus kroppenstedtii]|uniref:alpha/beta hydrolase n=1 Tax=Rhodococcoides kroppenstedtii TaxID=293050 RepID=UPI001C9B3892|nr:alpha/beta hydrolase [Rhodococcus kroppenstedtii]MBY6435068.1 alpha/beta hydrolase [Rhodococcus kroppenstedtii]
MTDTTLVMLPGTGSDAAFVRAAFGPASAAAGWSSVAVDPTPSDLIAGYRRALDDAAREAEHGGGRLLVGGVSIGAAVAARWLLDRARSGAADGVVDGVIAVMPAWTGDPDSAPAAVLARGSAEMLRRDGLEVTLDRMAASSPDWLVRTLAPSWRSQWPALPDALDEAAAYPSPTTDDLAALDVPVAVVGVDGDPVHPVSVARAWTAAARRGAITTTTLDEVGRDSAVLGRCARDAMAVLSEASA